MSWQVWANEDGLSIEYIDGDRHIVLAINDMSAVHYAIKRNGTFEPGKHSDPHGICREIVDEIARFEVRPMAVDEPGGNST